MDCKMICGECPFFRYRYGCEICEIADEQNLHFPRDIILPYPDLACQFPYELQEALVELAVKAGVTSNQIRRAIRNKKNGIPEV